jgi:formylmethanofuran dehydrogenase subunit B
MHCPHCSLFCDQLPVLQSCSLRASCETAAQRRMIVTGTNTEPPSLESLRESLTHASSILVTGNLISVECSRAAIRFSNHYRAILDGWPSNQSGEYTQSLARVGMTSVSLSEAREITDCFVVVGNDRLTELFPKLSERLSTAKQSSCLVVLLGEFSERTISSWKAHFTNVWSVQCPLTSASTALQVLSPSKLRDDPVNEPNASAEKVESLLDRVRGSRYTTMVWSSVSMELEALAPWIDQLSSWITEENESRRVASLHLALRTATFQQVCSWITGFPGRIQCLANGDVDYEPDMNTTKRWIEHYGHDPDAVLVLVDESSFEPQLWTDSELSSLKCKVVHLSSRPSSLGNVTNLPCGRLGIDYVANVFRADGVVLARCETETSSNDCRETPSPADWLERLVS